MLVEPLGPLAVVSYNDPAIDAAGKEGRWRLRQYIERRDPALLVFRPGMTPVRFWVRPMHTRAREWVEDQLQTRARYTRAFRVCVERVEGLDTPSGPYVPDTTPVEWLGSRFDILSDRAVEFLEGAGWTTVINEVGGVAYQRAYLDPFGGGRYSPVHGSPVLWESRLGADGADASETQTTSPAES